MEEKSILEKVGDLVVEKTMHFDVVILPKNSWHGLLQRWRLRPSKKSLSIRPVVYGSLIRISREVLQMEEVEETVTGMGKSMQLMERNGDRILRILAIAIQNNRHEPSPALIRLLKENLSALEVLSLYAYMLERMDLNSFILTINSIRGWNVLESAKKKEESELSPTSQGS